MNPAALCIARANEAAMTHAHEAHAAGQRAIHAISKTARALARQEAPRHDTGLYALSDTEALYARRLLLQATMAAFGDTAEGKLLRALDAWQTLGCRQRFYTEADSLEADRIGGALTGATLEIAEEITALQKEIDGDG